MIPQRIIKEMFRIAQKSMNSSNVSDENHKVGAAALGESGKIYGGCCLISVPQDYCAERVALFKAVSEGEKKIEAILITKHGKREKIGGPCGICLNALWQLSNNPELEIILQRTNEKKPIIKKIRDFYPYPYTSTFKF